MKITAEECAKMQDEISRGIVLVDQTVLHDPERGKTGNCFSAVLSSLLDVPVEDIPVFAEHDDWLPRLQKWLKQYGLCFLSIGADSEWLERIGVSGLHHDLAGKSPRHEGVHHATVGKDGVLLFDPHPSKQGIGDDVSIGALAVLEPWKHAKAFATLPKILKLVAEQQQRIAELELANAIAWGNPAEPAEIVAQHNRIVMRRCVEICENMADTLQSSDCTDCANAIRKEMVGKEDD